MKHDESYIADTIVEIKQMALALVTINKRLKQRVSELEVEKKSWREDKKTMEIQLQTLQDDYKTLKFAKSLSNGKEDGEAKMQISKLMREIDQCMLLIQSL